MAKTIAVVNQKGGVGKSTTASALAAGLSLKGYKVLVVDMDVQANTSYAANAQLTGLPTVLEVMTEAVSATRATQHLPVFDIIPSSSYLTGADTLFVDLGKEYRLKEGLEDVRDKYDFIVIDTPPTLGILVINALTASDSILIPAQADIFSVQGIAQLTRTIQSVQKYSNPALKIEGILLTRYSQRAVLSREVAEYATNLAKTIGTKVFKTAIREAIAVKEAQINKKSLFEYAPKEKVTEDYRALVEELLGE